MTTALITGASRGLGLAVARTLARDGWTLLIDGRDTGALKSARDRLSADGGQVRAIAGDVADVAHRRALAAAAAELGRLDALVHNASELGPSPLPALADYPLERLHHVFAVNVFAPLALTQLVLPLMRPGGKVVAVTSDAAHEPYPGWGGYGASKAALEQLMRVLGAERPDLGVYAVDPGDMNTRMHQDAFPGEDISDRPDPEESAPGVVRLLTGDLPSGRYEARALLAVAS